MATLEERLEHLAEWLDDCKTAIGPSPTVPLPASTAAIVSTKTSNSAELIDAIYDPNESPSLDPVNAGTVIGSYDPTTLVDFAADCVTLSTQAHAESQTESPDDDYIGDRLKTINALLPGYRAAAGLTLSQAA
jgi:hypothetical protein